MAGLIRVAVVLPSRAGAAAAARVLALWLLQEVENVCRVDNPPDHGPECSSSGLTVTSFVKQRQGQSAESRRPTAPGFGFFLNRDFYPLENPSSMPCLLGRAIFFSHSPHSPCSTLNASSTSDVNHRRCARPPAVADELFILRTVLNVSDTGFYSEQDTVLLLLPQGAHGRRHSQRLLCLSRHCL